MTDDLADVYGYAMRDYSARIAEQQAEFARTDAEGDFTKRVVVAPAIGDTNPIR
jgi:hypothetical protein